MSSSSESTVESMPATPAKTVGNVDYHGGIEEEDDAGISSDVEKPFNAMESSLRLFFLYQKPEAAHLQTMAEQIEPRLKRSNPLIRKCIDCTLFLISACYQRRYSRRAGLAIGERALSFLSEVSKLDLARKTHPASQPGSALNIHLANIRWILKTAGSDFAQFCDPSDSLWYARGKYLRRQLRTLATQALTSLKAAVQDAELSLGMGSKARRFLFKTKEITDRTPIFDEGLVRTFASQLQRTHRTWILRDFDDMDQYPDITFYSEVTSHLRLLDVHPKRYQGSSMDEDETTSQDSILSSAGADSDTNADDFDEDSDYDQHIANEVGWKSDIESLFFGSTEDIREWRRDAQEGVTLITERQQEHNSLRTRSPQLHLAHSVVDLLIIERWEQAAVAAELLVLYYRHLHQVKPSVASTTKVCRALAMLALILCKADRRLEAVHASEQAVRLFKPVFLESQLKHADTMARLLVTYSRSLLSYKDSTSVQSLRISHTRRAFRAVAQAVKLFFDHSRATSTFNYIGGALARALLLSARAGREILQDRADAFCTHEPCLAEMGINYTMPRFKLEPRFSHPALRDGCALGLLSEHGIYLHLRMIDDRVPHWEGSIELARQACAALADLAQGPPEDFFEAMRLEAMLFHAEMLDMSPDRAIPVCKEAIEAYEIRAVAFPRFFDFQLAQLHYKLALHLRTTAQIEEATSVMEEVIGMLKHKSHRDHGYWQLLHWRGRLSVMAFNTAQALLFALLGRFDESTRSIERSETAIMEERQTSSWRETSETTALRGFLHWLQGRPSEAAQELRDSIPAEKSTPSPPPSWPKRKDDKIRLHLNPILFEAWLGAALSSTGDAEGGHQACSHAVTQMRAFLEARSKNKIENLDYVEDEALFPVEQLLAHLLVLLAGTLIHLDVIKEATQLIDEALRLAEDKEVVRIDPATLKTALLMKIRLMEGTPPSEQTGTFRLRVKALAQQAKKLPLAGFLHQMGCSLSGPTGLASIVSGLTV